MQYVSALLGSTALTAARDVQWLYFTASTTFTPSQDMEVMIHVLGSSGAGGCGSGGSNGGHNATGAGAGGYAIKRATLKAGVTYTITIGAGGANVVAIPPNRVNGNDGSSTSFVGGSLNIVANGGKGGKCTASNVAALGGEGGTASGGDKNYTGGRGGNISANATVQNAFYRASGGGALNLFGTGDCNGGDITRADFTSSVIYASGGGSCVKSAPSNPDISNSPGGDLTLFGANNGFALTLVNRSIFGRITTIGPAGMATGAFGPLAGGAPQWTGGEFAGSGGNSGAGVIPLSSGGNRSTPGGSAGDGSSSSYSQSSDARPGAVYLEVLG